MIFTGLAFNVESLAGVIEDLGYVFVPGDNGSGKYSFTTDPNLSSGHKTAIKSMFEGGGFYAIITP